MPRKKLYEDRSEETIALSIRVPESMRKIIEDRAWKNRRSLNQEIVWLLEQAMQMIQQESDSVSKRSSR